MEWLERATESIAAHFFNHKINADAKSQLETLAQKQAAELVEIHRLQKQTYQTLELKLKEVEEEKLKNEEILQGCVDGVLVFDAEGKIEFCNQAAADMLCAPVKHGNKTWFSSIRFRKLISTHAIAGSSAHLHKILSVTLRLKFLSSFRTRNPEHFLNVAYEAIHSAYLRKNHYPEKAADDCVSHPGYDTDMFCGSNFFNFFHRCPSGFTPCIQHHRYYLLPVNGPCCSTHKKGTRLNRKSIA